MHPQPATNDDRSAEPAGPLDLQVINKTIIEEEISEPTNRSVQEFLAGLDEAAGEPEDVVSLGNQDYDEVIGASSYMPSGYKVSSVGGPGRATPSVKVIMAFNDLRRANSRALRSRNTNYMTAQVDDPAGARQDDMLNRLLKSDATKREKEEALLKDRLNLELNYETVMNERLRQGLQQLDSTKREGDSTKVVPSAVTKICVVNASDQEYDKSFYDDNPEGYQAQANALSQRVQNMRLKRRSVSMSRFTPDKEGALDRIYAGGNEADFRDPGKLNALSNARRSNSSSMISSVISSTSSIASEVEKHRTEQQIIDLEARRREKLESRLNVV